VSALEHLEIGVEEDPDQPKNSVCARVLLREESCVDQVVHDELDRGLLRLTGLQ
jgi:hypothetical protein